MRRQTFETSILPITLELFHCLFILCGGSAPLEVRGQLVEVHSLLSVDSGNLTQVHLPSCQPLEAVWNSFSPYLGSNSSSGLEFGYHLQEVIP